MPMSTEETYQYNLFKRDYERWKRKITEEIKKNEKWIDIIACDVYECDEDDEPLYTDEGMLEDSRIENLEERLDNLNINNRLNSLESRLGLVDGRGHGDIGAGAGGRKRRRKRKTRKKRRKKKTKKKRKKRSKKNRKKRTKRRKK